MPCYAGQKVQEELFSLEDVQQSSSVEFLGYFLAEELLLFRDGLASVTNAYSGADMKPIANGAPEGAQCMCVTTFKEFSLSDTTISKDTPFKHVAHED